MAAGPPAERPSPRAATLHDVARLAGVSVQTASRVANDHPSVRSSTRRRVEEAIRQLGYRPNPFARGLATARSRTIGVIVADNRPFGPAATLLAIERVARAAGYATTVTSLDSPDPASIVSAVDALAHRLVGGMIVLGPGIDSTADRPADGSLPAGLPLVTIGGSDRGDWAVMAAMTAVAADQVSGARQATDHLLGLGHGTVWHVGGPHDSIEARERVAGWRASLAAAGVTPPALIRGDWSASSGYRAGRELAARGDVTAVFAANDQMAFGVVRGCHEAGLEVPADVSVVGFDDAPESEFWSPPLTTVRQDFDELGRRGVQLLIAAMGGEPDGRPGGAAESASVASRLVVRQSSAAPRHGHRRTA